MYSTYVVYLQEKQQQDFRVHFRQSHGAHRRGHGVQQPGGRVQQADEECFASDGSFWSCTPGSPGGEQAGMFAHVNCRLHTCRQTLAVL